MSTEYVRKEVEKIINNEEAEYPKNVAMASAWIIGNLKGANLKVFDVEKRSALADYYVIGSATNSTQAQAMSEAITNHLKKFGYKTKSCEGHNDAEWILIDLGDVIIHIFQDNSRAIYDLDSLWVESDLVEIPSSYYFSEPETEGVLPESNSDKDFF